MEGYSISRAQKQFLDLLQDDSLIELLVGGSAGGAKSMCICLAATLMSRQYPGARFFIGRKTLKSLRQSTINTLLGKVHPLLGIEEGDFHFSSQNQELLYKNGSLIIFGELDYAPSDPDYARLGSLEIDWAFIDEAGEITLEAKNAIKSRVGRGVLSSEYGIPGKIILSCNPSANFLRQEYYDPYEKLGAGRFQKWPIGTMQVAGEKQQVYRGFLRMGATDNPFLPQSYIDNLATLPDRERKRLLEGNWNYIDEDDSLFRTGLLEKAITYELSESGEKFNKFIGCFDESTEILTESGFKKFKDLNGEKVLARDKDGNSGYINYDNYIEYDYDGDMYELDTARLSFKVTPNHKMLYTNRWGKLYREEIQNIDLHEWNIVRQHNYIDNSFEQDFWTGLGIEKNDWFSFMGWFISEGCVVGHRVINITQKTIQHKNTIRELLNRMKIRFSESGQSFFISNKTIASHLLQFVKKYAHNKEIPDYITFSSDKIAIECFLDAYCDGDGTRRNGRRLSYCSSSKKIIDSLQIILAHQNKQGKLYLKQPKGSHSIIEGRVITRKHDVYELTERWRDTNYSISAGKNLEKITKKHYSGKVYCVSNRLHTIYVRRKGTCYWIGNCDVSDKGSDSTIYSLIDNGVLVAQKRSAIQMNWLKDSEQPISRLLADELIEFAQRNGFTPQQAKHIAVESNGIGVGIRDMLKERGWFLTEYVATHKSRSQGYYQLMLDMDSGDTKILNSLNGLDELRKQLAAHSYEMINQEPSVVKKEKIKQIIGHSPDEADSFMIANWIKNWLSNPQNDPKRNKNRILF